MKKILVIGLLVLGAAPAWAGVAENRLLQAVRDGDHAGIRSALAAKANVNALLPDKSSVLAWAVDRQDAESVRLLLAAGAQPRALVAGAVQPLSLACELGDPAIAGALIKAGANAKEIRADGTTAFALCAGTSTPEVLAAMTARGADVNAANVQGQTPLMWAAMSGNIEAIKWLSGHGAKVNAADKKGFTPLFFALRSKVPGAPMALLNSGADVNAVLSDGTSVMQAAMLVGNPSFAIEAVSHGADLKRMDKDGRQVIHLAAMTGSVDLVKILLTKGVDPNTMTVLPYAPVVVASAAAVAGVPPRLPIQPMPVPATPLQFAARAGSVEVMKLLVAAGAKPDLKGPDGMTVAIAAAGSGHPDAMQYAYEIDPNLDAISRGKRSIMHIAVTARGTPDPIGVIQFLVDKGAKLNAQDDHNAYPVDEANRNADPIVREYFVKLIRDRGLLSTNH
jgi:ankyrin repeat protein